MRNADLSAYGSSKKKFFSMRKLKEKASNFLGAVWFNQKKGSELNKGKQVQNNTMDLSENPDMFPNNKGLTKAPSLLDPRGQKSKVPESGACDSAKTANNTAYSEHNEKILRSQCLPSSPQKNLNKRTEKKKDEKKDDKRDERREPVCRARFPLLDEHLVADRRARYLTQAYHEQMYGGGSSSTQLTRRSMLNVSDATSSSSPLTVGSETTRPLRSETKLLNGSDNDTEASNLLSTRQSQQLRGKGKMVATCACGHPVVNKISWTCENPGRKFVACKFFNYETGQRGCNTFEWLDEGMNEWQRDVANVLIAENHWLITDNNILKSRIICDGHERFRRVEELEKMKNKPSKELWWIQGGGLLRNEGIVNNAIFVCAIVSAIVTFVLMKLFG